MAPRRLPNPYAEPFYVSVALAILGIATLAIAVEDHLERERTARDTAEAEYYCGTGSADASPARPAALDADAKLGAAIFRGQCASCHNKNMKDNLTGPALGGVAERWADYPREDLYAWIRNSQTLIRQGHPRATQLWMEWGPTVMSNYPGLTDGEIEALLAYIDQAYVSPGYPLVVACP